MRPSTKSSISAVLCILFVICIGSLQMLNAQDDKNDKKKQELLRKIEELRKQKENENKKLNTKLENSNASTEDQKVTLDQYATLLAGCTQKSDRCADVIYTYAYLLYRYEQARLIESRNIYNDLQDTWEKTKKGPEPVYPKPDYSKCVNMYSRLLKEYPSFPKIDEALYQLSNIYVLAGVPDSAKTCWETLVDKMPNSRRAADAHFRLGDLEVMEYNYSAALKHFEKVQGANITAEVVSGTNFRKAECYYNMGEFQKAVALFFDYIEKCEAGIFPCEFKTESLDYLSVCFADMENGAQEAISFFKKVGHRPYEDMVLYTVGMKNAKHTQLEEAILALKVALKQFPYYKDAPVAQTQLINCYMLQKKMDNANQAREDMVDNYGPNSEWTAKNNGQKAVIEQANREIKKALSLIPVYYHIQAQKTKDKALYQKALKRYVEFFQKFPDDKWTYYEYKFNVAEIYSALGDYANAAECYHFVSNTDLSTYGKFVREIDTIGLSKEEIAQEIKKSRQPLPISQEDAGYNAVLMLDQARKKAIAKAGVSEVQAYNYPETKNFIDEIHAFQKKFPQSNNSPEFVMLVANVHYAAQNYENTVKECNVLLSTYPNAPASENALIMLAKCYSSLGEYEVALQRYKELLKRKQPDSKEYDEIMELAAAAIYKKADKLKTAGNLAGAADAFKSIAVDYPKSKIAERGYFDAASCYEAASSPDQAAAAYEDFAAKYPNSAQYLEKAYFLAAENYKKANKIDRAAKVYESSAMRITKPEFAMSALGSASDCYQKVGNFDQAAKMYVTIYERYAADPKASGALYQAGLLYEKSKNYSMAISAYMTMVQKFPSSEYAADASFAIGDCMEKLGDFAGMAKVFSDYAVKYQDDKYKQVEALIRAGDAYYNMKDFASAQKDYMLAVEVNEKFGKKTDIDPASISKAYYKLGEVKYQEFLAYPISGSNAKLVTESIKTKEKKLGEAGEKFAAAIKLGVTEWTLRSTYMLAQGFFDEAEAVKNQPFFGSKTQRFGQKIMLVSTLEKYYQKSQEYCGRNIEWAFEQNLSGDYVDKSIDLYMKLGFLTGDLYEEVGRLLKDSPIPDDFSAEDKQIYQEELEEKSLKSMDEALPRYERLVQDAAKMGVPKNQWLEKVRDRIREIQPTSAALQIEITERKVAPPAPVQAVDASKPNQQVAASVSGSQQQLGYKDVEYDRDMRRIQNIVSMDVSVADKIKQLGRIENEAKRKIALEEEKIADLKK